MNNNLNSGYGAALAHALHSQVPPSGKLFIVGDSNTVNIDMIKEIFGVDPDGKVRYHSTTDAAINVASASAGDLVLIAPGHTETISGASGITSDVAGLTIIGLGNGADRPTYTFSATDSTWVVSGASSVIKNIIAVPSIDSVVSPFVISGADCDIDVEIQDASAAVECVRGILTTATADRLKLNLRYHGFTGGNACVNAVRLVGGTGARVNVDFYGKASTSVVELHTTAVVDTKIAGTFYVSGTTDLSKNVVDTVTASTWSVDGFDSAAGAAFSGGSGNAIASELQVPRIVLKSTGDLTASGTSVALFTVTGDVLMKVGGSVDVAVTCTSGTSTAEVGVAGNTAALCVQDSIDGTAFDVGDSWSLITAADANAAQMADEWVLIGNGANVIMTVSVDDITAGDIDFYCQYIPLTSDSSVVAA